MSSSSTSSSEPHEHDAMSRLPASAQARTLLVVAVASVALLAGWEWHLRGGDATRFPKTDAQMAAARVRKPAADGKARLFLFGSSRAQFGISPAVLEQELGNEFEIRHAAVPHGNGPGQMHACMDWFRKGEVVVVECFPRAVYRNERDIPDAEMAAHMTHYGISAWEEELNGAIRERLMFARGDTSPSEEMRVAAHRASGTTGARNAEANLPKATTVHEDGWRECLSGFDEERAMLTVEAWREVMLSGPHDSMDLVLRRTRDDVRELEQRGVTVLFLRMPSAGLQAADEEREFPRAQYWARMEREFPGRCWHYADFEATRGLATFDNSHLTGPSARKYSRWLGARLRHFLETNRR